MYLMSQLRRLDVLARSTDLGMRQGYGLGAGASTVAPTARCSRRSATRVPAATASIRRALLLGGGHGNAYLDVAQVADGRPTSNE